MEEGHPNQMPPRVWTPLARRAGCGRSRCRCRARLARQSAPVATCTSRIERNDAGEYPIADTCARSKRIVTAAIPPVVLTPTPALSRSSRCSTRHSYSHPLFSLPTPLVCFPSSQPPTPTTLYHNLPTPYYFKGVDRRGGIGAPPRALRDGLRMEHVGGRHVEPSAPPVEHYRSEPVARRLSIQNHPTVPTLTRLHSGLLPSSTGAIGL